MQTKIPCRKDSGGGFFVIQRIATRSEALFSFIETLLPSRYHCVPFFRSLALYSLFTLMLQLFFDAALAGTACEKKIIPHKSSSPRNHLIFSLIIVFFFIFPSDNQPFRRQTISQRAAAELKFSGTISAGVMVISNSS